MAIVKWESRSKPWKIQTLQHGKVKNIYDLEFALYNVYKTLWESNSWMHNYFQNTSSYTNIDMENRDYKLQK